jgi:hypothetical protein
MIKKTVLCLLCMSLFLSIPGCKKAPPAAPEVILPTTQSITVISSSSLLYIGTSETFTATAHMSDGSSSAVIGGAWGGDNPSVATVGPVTGLVTIVGSGTVNIFVTYGGKQGSKPIRGLPNYQGTWTGTYRVDSCTCTGDYTLANFCSYLPSGKVLQTNLILTQTLDSVSGTFFLGTLSATATGPVATNGQLTLTGKITSSTSSIDAIFTLQSTTPGQITGGLFQLWTDTSMSGNAQVTCTIVSLSRTSTMTMALAPSAPRMLTPTLQDLLRELQRRIR